MSFTYTPLQAVKIASTRGLWRDPKEVPEWLRDHAMTFAQWCESDPHYSNGVRIPANLREHLWSAWHVQRQFVECCVLMDDGWFSTMGQARAYVRRVCPQPERL